MPKSYNVVDLFCGCGGFSLGFFNVGFNVRLGVDVWDDAIRTYGHNNPHSIALCKDVADICGNSITELIGLHKDDIDVIIGGPPCQGFSLSGKREQSDPRNELYKSFVRIVKDVRPKVFLLENVPGLIKLFKGKALESIIEDFSKLGYSVTYEVLSSDNYGVPQQRRRVFIVGINSDKIKQTSEFVFPTKTNESDTASPLLTCKDAISDLDFVPDDRVLGEEIEYNLPATTAYQIKMREDSFRLTNHSITLHKERTKEIIDLVPDGGNYKSLPLELQSTRKVNIAWTRMNSEKPCFTIDTGHNHHFHYRANRVPTVRESARIQSFPDKFRFLGTKTSQLKQVGNAVPPLVAEALAKQIKILLDKG
ncbi:MAG: DNA cytosine methyltransferase [Defluviitaleaceae bacterium]|nr:DNA cytosine methyltransferase [Defluviitaleaceae bacterium]